MITLLDGSEYDEANLVWDETRYRVTDAIDGTNLTNLVRQSDKARLIPDFDRAIDNERAFAEKYVRENGKTPPPVGSTSTFVNFWHQISTDPLQAPIAVALGQGASGPGLGGNSTAKIVKTIAVVGGILLALYTINTVVNAVKTAKA